MNTFFLEPRSNRRSDQGAIRRRVFSTACNFPEDWRPHTGHRKTRWLGWVTLCLIFFHASPIVLEAVAQDLPSIEQIDQQKSESSDSTSTESKSLDLDGNDDPDDSKDESVEDQELFVDQIAAKAFGAPPEAKRLSKRSNLWVDPLRKRVYVDGYVAMDKGMLEMFACPSGTKDHESVVGVLAMSSEIHAALLAVGAKTGTTVRIHPNFVPPTGQQIRIWVCWLDKDDQFHVVDGRTMIRYIKSKKTLKEDWVFAGSSEWTDPADGKVYYQADGGDMICVSNFSTAMLDLPFLSSDQADGLLFEPESKTVPPRDTPVRLVLVPIPVPTDKTLSEKTQKEQLLRLLPPKRRVLPKADKPAAS